ncbi:hypothetical protein Q3G72_010372 [Acer saccharum]|nr:hypothetical protein Q3G72_010372 [Acer saccharum]
MKNKWTDPIKTRLHFIALKRSGVLDESEQPDSLMSDSIPPTLDTNFRINPYTIHHSDSPSTILVSPLLSEDNYGSWSRAATMALRAKIKLGFVDGSVQNQRKQRTSLAGKLQRLGRELDSKLGFS